MVFDLAFNDRRPRTWQIADKIDIEAQCLLAFNADTGSGNAHNCIGKYHLASPFLQYVPEYMISTKNPQTRVPQ